MEELVFGRRYRVTEKVGSGGMAEVYKAVDEVLGRTVAVKVLHPRYASDPGFVARFRQEAQAAANLSHPGIVNIYDWGRDNETYFIVMEYVHGTDLKALVSQRGALDPMKAAEWASQVCAALAVAHGYDIIHRDIKPHNIVLAPDGTVKVMDFGIARAGNTTMTQTGSVLGTAHYVSPEQAQGRALGPSSDLYSLGIVLYELTTGRLPFDADTPVAVALKQVNEEPVPPRRINPEIPEALEAVIMRALQKDPSARYSSADEMRTDLKRVVAGGLVQAPAAVAAGGMDETSVMPAVGGAAAGAPRVRPVPQRRNPWPWIVAVVLVLTAGLGIAWALGAFERTEMVVVPDVIGLTLEEAAEEIQAAQLAVGPTTTRASDEHEEGLIIEQSPEGEEEAPEGSEITLVISGGPDLVEVPDVVERTESDAMRILRDLDFEVNIEREYNSDVPDGQVFRQSPEAGETAAPESTVTIVISRGTQLVRVPDVGGKTKDAATAELEGVGFRVNPTEEFHDSVAAGRVISQSPESGVSIDSGSTVTIRISKGRDEVTVPDVIELSEAQARRDLRDAGLDVDVSYQVSPEDDVVLTQDPLPGQKVARNSTVKILVGKAPPPEDGG
ncbi:MAG: Stk1 family PASTA domain-containing Ser/Thr kinase [Anaerosomatales bacterium]|nr:Stk1 family PASTA domain-containing Ser/Thr kinase [Anaerosomatales bacterium]MDT8433638.1 Stk1 family PASTA domain-containing Ser/Thr kinase [Anaerosomatales bacterium]